MLIKRSRGWELPESAVTPEHVFNDRRSLMKGIAAGSIIAGLPPALLGATMEEALAAEFKDPTLDLYPAKRNLRYKPLRKPTDPKWALTYNNFYEFGGHKRIWRAAQRLPLRPWTVTFDGMVEKKTTVDIDTLIRKMPLEERIYGLRCVEAWSMVVPWSGFPMKALVELAKPLSSAKYVQMQTFMNPKVAPGQRQSWYPWPYTEGLTIAEATHELAFLVTGIYGKPLGPQNGAPLRLSTPWKYGFKQVKSLVRFTFTDKRPVSFWQKLQGREYGFWANVNPKVDHPRWSQARERVLGTDDVVPTQLFNGYAEYIGDLYAAIKGEQLYR